MNIKLIATGVITAITASLCCVTPVLALIAGTTGIASTFSWIEPFRPYLMGLTVLILGYAWYQKLKFVESVDCACETDEKPKFIQSKTFLAIVTVFAVVMLAFPYYSGFFYPTNEKEKVVVNTSDLTTTEFKISGMTCASCEAHVNHAVNTINGVVQSKTSYQNGNAIIAFDKTQTNEAAIEKAINSTGYSVTTKKEHEWKFN
ncbi:mercuric transport protein MerTP [Mariniflexile sp. AS56]|uniref:mercuric transport protein MerTP n=1 Tax=Mariniflexile sp. AS56 TaxID=3063957 RepID=UPI0026F2B49D|nr:mercuric transport protein MerTP [Mariniflexile sp. AS56]MDO7171120.1 mercuric transport protein MerTP [Mariniflexile sp. AS56]